MFLEISTESLDAGEIPPDGQHHLCEEGRKNETEEGDPRRFVAPIQRKSENEDEIRGFDLIRTSVTERASYLFCQRTFDVVFGWMRLTFCG